MSNVWDLLEKMYPEITQVARSLELYNIGVQLQKEALAENHKLELTRHAPFRKRSEVGNLVVAFGSYDPLSLAHVNLFLNGLDTVKDFESSRGKKAPNELLVVTSTTHFDKKIYVQKNSAIYDRVHAQEGFASCLGNVSLAFFNNPYFVNLLPAINDVYGQDVDIYFVVGGDVIEKIADEEEYRKRGFKPKKVLDALLSKSKFIISEREVTYHDEREPRIVDRDLVVAENPILEDYTDNLISINIRGDYSALSIPIQKVSSTVIRNLRNEGQPIDQLVAVGISEFVDQRGLYLTNSDMYEAFVCARELFASKNQGLPIHTYISGLMRHLRNMESDENLRASTIKEYHDFFSTR